jgi:integrase
MARQAKGLTDTAVKTAKPAEKQRAMFDGGGLYLLISPNGGKYWRFKYRFEGNEKLLAFGTYPEITLAKARERRDAARRMVAEGIDPGAVRKAQKEAKSATADTFEVIAREWIAKNSPAWSASHIKTVTSRLERDVYPIIGNRPLAELKPREMLALLQRVEARGVLETASRIKSYSSQIFRYAVATGRAETDPTAPLKGALSKKTEKHHAALTDPKEVAALLRAIDDFNGTFVVKCALQLAPLFFVRPGELHKAEWIEFDLDAAEWNIPAARMKMKTPHLVPLARQAVTILRELHKLTGSGRYVFPCQRTSDRPMSNIAMLAALRRMGFDKEEMTTHGFRAMARTILDEVLGVRPDFIEHQLAHAVRDPLGRAYNRTAHLAERKKMMQLWADYLDGLKKGAKVIPFKKAAGD